MRRSTTERGASLPLISHRRLRFPLIFSNISRPQDQLHPHPPILRTPRYPLFRKGSTTSTAVQLVVADLCRLAHGDKLTWHKLGVLMRHIPRFPVHRRTTTASTTPNTSMDILSQTAALPISHLYAMFKPTERTTLQDSSTTRRLLILIVT